METAAILSEALGHHTHRDDAERPDGGVRLGAAKSPAGMEENYAKSQLEWAHQSFDGRMDYSIVATSTVQDLLGRPALTLREWVPRHREALLAAASK